MTTLVAATEPAGAGPAPAWIAILVLLGALVCGVYVVAVLDRAAGRLRAGRRMAVGSLLSEPFRHAALLVHQAPTRTERPDATLWAFAPAAYAGLGALALSVIPFGRQLAVADVRTGIVVFGAAEALIFVAVYLHGWSANAALPLIGGYRFVAQGFSFMLVSMFVLIAVALPAESMSIGRIVESQSGSWNVVRQPLGLPLFVVVALGAAFWGPLNLPDGHDLAGGTAAEVSGPQYLAWATARRCLLVTYAAMTASAFLGGYLGPVLPGPIWLALKTFAVLVLFVAAGHLVARPRPQQFVLVAWVVLLPLAFLDLALAGWEALP